MDLITFLHCLFIPILLIRYFNLKQCDFDKDEFTFSPHSGAGKISYNLNLRVWIIWNIYAGIIDIIFIPLLIIDIISIYNGIEIYHLIIDTQHLDQSRVNKIRIQIVINFFILLFDIICIMPLLLIILITIYRVPKVYKQWKLSWHNYYALRNNNNNNNMPPMVLPMQNTRLFIFYQFLLIFVDTPCLLMAIFVFLTLFRCNKLYNKLMDDNRSANKRRLDCLYQTFFVLRDIIFLIPFLMMICSLFRAPILILELMTQANKPRIGNEERIHFKVYKCVIEFPLKGKPLFHIKAKKETDFRFNDGKCKCLVLGNTLWNNISNIFGSSMATAAQSMLPNKLWNEHGMNYNDK